MKKFKTGYLVKRRGLGFVIYEKLVDLLMNDEIDNTEPICKVEIKIPGFRFVNGMFIISRLTKDSYTNKDALLLLNNNVEMIRRLKTKGDYKRPDKYKRIEVDNVLLAVDSNIKGEMLLYSNLDALLKDKKSYRGYSKIYEVIVPEPIIERIEDGKLSKAIYQFENTLDYIKYNTDGIFMLCESDYTKYRKFNISIEDDRILEFYLEVAKNPEARSFLFNLGIGKDIL